MTPESGIAPSLPLRVLVADDDAASRRFLLDALRLLGAEAAAAADGSKAMAMARVQRFDLLLLDCRMPGAGGEEVWARLRGDPQAASRGAIAVATTAEPTPASRAALLSMGFADILVKPCHLAELRRLVALVPAAGSGLPVLDDAAALLATGDSTTMRALRQLLQQELTALWGELEQLCTNAPAFRDRLHRLRSSCGFCGAAALSGQIVSLQRQWTNPGDSDADAALDGFRKVLMDTLQALDRPQQPAAPVQGRPDFARHPSTSRNDEQKAG